MFFPTLSMCIHDLNIRFHSDPQFSSRTTYVFVLEEASHAEWERIRAGASASTAVGRDRSEPRGESDSDPFPVCGAREACEGGGWRVAGRCDLTFLTISEAL